MPETPLAVLRLGAEKTHQGFLSRNPALYLGFGVCNSTTALGLQATAVLNRVGSRCTGKERDTESGNDYFGARYYNSSMGRWMSPDWSAKAEPVPYAKLDNPQSLNLYAYVGNNPMTRVDPDGHVADPCKGRQDCTVDVDKGRKQLTVTQTSQSSEQTTDKDGNTVTTVTKTTNKATFSTRTGKFVNATTQTTKTTAVKGHFDVQVGATTTVDRQTAVTNMSPEAFNGASEMAHASTDFRRDMGLLGKEVGTDVTALGICAGTAGIACPLAIGGDVAATATFEAERADEKAAEADE
jgi:RHS repeat-associated protein